MQKKSWYILIGVLSAILLAGLIFIAVMPEREAAPTEGSPSPGVNQQPQESVTEQPDKEPAGTGAGSEGTETPNTSGNEAADQETTGEAPGKEDTHRPGTPEKDPTQGNEKPDPTESGKGDRYETPRDYS